MCSKSATSDPLRATRRLAVDVQATTLTLEIPLKKLLITLSVAAGMVLSACGSPNCEAMKKECDACTNTTGKASCNAAYTTYTTVGGSAGDTSCKVVVDAKTYAADGAVCKAQ